MTNTITLRPYQSYDRNALIDIIRRTWKYDRFASAKTARRMATLYLDNCLCTATFTQVAVQNGHAIGSSRCAACAGSLPFHPW